MFLFSVPRWPFVVSVEFPLSWQLTFKYSVFKRNSWYREKHVFNSSYHVVWPLLQVEFHWIISVINSPKKYPPFYQIQELVMGSCQILLVSYGVNNAFFLHWFFETSWDDCLRDARFDKQKLIKDWYWLSSVQPRSQSLSSYRLLGTRLSSVHLVPRLLSVWFLTTRAKIRIIVQPLAGLKFCFEYA